MDQFDPWQSQNAQQILEPRKVIMADALQVDAIQNRVSQDELLRELCLKAANGEDLQLLLNQFNAAYPILMPRLLDKQSVGDTALCQAAKNGHLEVVRQLLDAGVSVDAQDSQHWTAYQWAIANGHDQCSALLTSYGANTQIQQVAVERRVETSQAFYMQGYDADAVDRELAEVLMLDTNFKLGLRLQDSQDNDDDDGGGGEDDITSPVARHGNFNYTECLPSQMLVVDAKQCELVVKFCVDDMQVPHISQASLSQKHAPSIIMFLCARYAHYFAGKDLLKQLMDTFVSRLRFTMGTRGNAKNLTWLSFWMANLSQLLFFMRRDHGLIHGTVDAQADVSELLCTMYVTFVGESRHRLLAIAVDALQYASLAQARPQLERRRIRKSKSLSAEQLQAKTASKTELTVDAPPTPQPQTGLLGVLSRMRANSDENRNDPEARARKFFATSTAKPQVPSVTSPKTLLTHLASTLFLLQSYHIHPVYQLQVVAQLVCFVGAELLNAFVDGRVECSRVNAIQVRFNISILEEWVRSRFVGGGGMAAENATAVDSLLDLIKTDDVELLLTPLLPAITICQLLQTVSSAFNDEALVGDTDEQILTAVRGLLKLQVELPALFNSRTSGMALSIEQLKRAAFENYQYEKAEPSVSGRLLQVIDTEIVNELKASGESPKKSLASLLSGSSPRAARSRPLLVDALDLLPFKLQTTYTSVSPLPATDNQQRWGDRNEQDESRQRIAQRNQRERDEEMWWLTVPVETPADVVSMLEPKQQST